MKLVLDYEIYMRFVDRLKKVLDGVTWNIHCIKSKNDDQKIQVSMKSEI